MPPLFKKILNRSGDAFFAGPIFDRVWTDRLNGKAICLCYHRVDEPGNHAFLTESGVPAITPEALKADIDFLKGRGFDFITFEDLRKKGALAPGRPHVILSFDDCYKDNYSKGLPILNAAGVRAVFFQTTSLVGARELMWEHALAWYYRGQPEKIYDLIETCPFEETRRILAAARESARYDESKLAEVIYPVKEDLISASRKGHEVASHGDQHYKRSNISAETFENDLGVSAEKILSWTGRRPQTYAYPHGNTVEGDREICAKYFSHAVTVKTGFIGAASDPLELPRFYWTGAPKNALRRKRWLLTGSS